MTETASKDIESIVEEYVEKVDEVNDIASRSSSSCGGRVDVETVNVVAGKNDIKVSEEGVGFLEDMQSGDSSLEPGEVKTPPPGSSPAMARELTPSRLAQEKPEPPAKQLAKETLAKALKTVSQLEAEACEEKVRAILELDAKRHKEELEKRKLEAEKRKQSGELDAELELKRKAKEERKKLKKLKKAKKAAEKALMSCDEGNENDSLRKKRKDKKANESEESEGLCSSGADDDDDIPVTANDKHSSILNSAINIPSMPPSRYPPHMPPPHILTEAFMGGFRPMNPFMRGPRPDFSHGRGGFIPRGRGGMRGRMPFQGFRPPFFANAANSGGGMGGSLKFNVPHNQHSLQQQRQHHTPPPNRGHSPILPPSSNLQWTKCKPSLSYAFKYNKEQSKFHGIHSDVKPHSSNRANSEINWCDDKPEAGDDHKQDDHQHKHEQIRKKDKKHKSLAKEKKKSKKHKSKDVKKSKRPRTSISSSSSLLKQKKKSSKSSRRKIEKIRKSYGSTTKTTPTPQQQNSSEDTETTENPQDDIEEDINPKTSESEEIPNEEEIRNTVENIKREKIESTEFKIEDLTLKVKPLIMIKTEPQEKEKVEEKSQEKQQEAPKADVGKSFDIFAESPPRPETSTKSSVTEKPAIDVGSVTPPLPPLNETKIPKTSLQNALEIQKRIDKLLQQDDIKLEAIEAAKDLLIKKTQKYQSSKEKPTPDRELSKAATTEQKSLETTTNTNKTTSLNQKEESSSTKEKPKAYKDKEIGKKSKVDDKESDKSKESSKHKDDKDSKQKEKSSIISKDKTKETDKEEKKTKAYDKEKDKDKSRSTEKDKTRKEISSSYRNPFKRSISRDRYFGKIDSRRRTRTKSREREFPTKRRLSRDRKRGDSSGYSSSRISSKRRISGSSSASTTFNRSKSGERDFRGSLDSLSNKEKERKDRKRENTPESRTKRKRSISPKRKSDKEKEGNSKSKTNDDRTQKLKSSTPPPKIKKSDAKLEENTTTTTKEHKKSKSPAKPAAKKRPLSFTQTEFLFPEEGNEDDFILGDDEETNDSFKDLKSPSDKEDSPDTDDYMDNWENDEDVDLDMNSNMPTDMSTPRKTSPDLTEEDSFVTRFVNPSPPRELLEKREENATETKEKVVQENKATQPQTPPLDLLKKLQSPVENKEIAQKTVKKNKETAEPQKTELFGMQELYDQFIKSVEASGVDMKTAHKEQIEKCQDETTGKEEDTTNDVINETQTQSEDPLSTSSTSTSSSTSSSSSSSSDSNSSSNSSSSSSSDSSSEDSNDGDEFKKSLKQSTKKAKVETTVSCNDSLMLDKLETSTTENIAAKSPPREPRTPSPNPLQKNLMAPQTPTTPVTQSKAIPKNDVAKDFKKLKNLEANLSRIQMMRANYDSNDEISEELHKMEMLFLQEKKIILQKYAKNTQTPEKPATIQNVKTTTEFVPVLPAQEFGILPPPPPPEEPNKIFDANREAIKLTISPLKLPSKPAIFNMSLNEETEKKAEDKDEMDFTEKLVKPAKEVAIVKPMMETKESKESRSRDSHRHRRSPVYGGSRDRQRSPTNYRERNRRSSSRNRFSPQRRGRGRSLSISPPRRGMGGLRHGSPPRRGAPGGRFRLTSRRSRSRSRSPLRQFGNRRGKEGSPFRRKRGGQQDLQSHYKKFGRNRSRSRSPQARPRSPRTPPPRRRSYSPDPYSRSPLPFKPPSPPMRRSLSPTDSNSSHTRRSRSPPSPRRPRSPRSPRSPQSPLSPRSPRSPRSPDSPPSHRYGDHRYRRDNSFERHSSISPHPQYYTQETLAAGVPPQASSYYYNVSPNRISLDARINIVLNAPGGGSDTPPAGYEGYTNYAQYGGAAYMTIPPQPMADPANTMGYYPNPYVPIMHAGPHEAHHGIVPPNVHAMHPHQPGLPPPHLQQQHPPHSPGYSNIPTINSGLTTPSSPLPPNNFYYNDYNMTHQPSNPVLKELPKASVAVQKGNVLEIVPSNVETSSTPQQSPQLQAQQQKTKTSPLLVETIKSHLDKISSISWKDEVNNRHVKSAVMRLNRGGENSMRSILKKSEGVEKADKCEKKKVYFEDGIYPSRDSDDEDRKLIEYKIRRKVLRLRKKRGIDVPAAQDLLEEKFKQTVRKPKIDAALEKLPPPPPPNTIPPAHLEQPIYLRPPTPVPLVYFHFDSVVHSMYVSQLEKPIPPRLLNPKCVPPAAGPVPAGSTIASGGGVTAGVGGGGGVSSSSPNLNIPNVATATKKELTTLAALNRVGRNENPMNSPKMMAEGKRESPNSQQSPLMSINKTTNLHFTQTQTSPQMSPLHGPPLRHNTSSPIGFVGMRVNNFMRLPPSPLTRAAVPPHMQNPPPHFPPGMVGMRHPQYNMPPPNLIPPDGNYSGNSTSYGTMQTPPPVFHNYGQRPYFVGSPMHPPPPILANHPQAKDKEHLLHPHHHSQQQQHHHHQLPAQHHMHPQQNQHQHNQHKPPPPLPPPIAGSNVVAASPQAMIAPYNVKKTVN